jgi:hypothetical protein
VLGWVEVALALAEPAVALRPELPVELMELPVVQQVRGPVSESAAVACAGVAAAPAAVSL